MSGFKRSWFFYVIAFFLLHQHDQSFAQIKKHLVYFTDKTSSPYSINNASQFLSARSIARRSKQGIELTSRDLPVNPSYVNAVKSLGAEVWYTSRWLNAALILADSLQMVSVKALPFVQNSIKINRVSTSSPLKGAQGTAEVCASSAYGSSLNQISMIGADQMHAQGFHGESIQIAVLDAGFKNANAQFYLDSLFNNNQILSTYDFVSHNSNVYDDDGHGTIVLSVLGGNANGQLIGSAYKAEFYLLRTEDAGSESVSEEVNWLMGAEYADSAGADIINSSLGYNTFDDPTTNHTYADMDGYSTIITKAANAAASSGMLVVNSMGNEGSFTWKYLIAPADSDSILAIGAVNATGAYVSFSSQGPSASGHIKPDLAAKGQGTVAGDPSNSIVAVDGTSFSCPLVAGLAAGIWQAYPDLTSSRLLEVLKKSGSQECHPDNYIGFGIPHFKRIQEIMGNSYDTKTCIYPSPFTNEAIFLNLNPSLKGQSVLVRLIDLNGRLIDDQLIESACLNNRLSLNTHGLSQGIYFIQVISGDKPLSFKVVKY
jgi:hypothetical protein